MPGTAVRYMSRGSGVTVDRKMVRPVGRMQSTCFAQPCGSSSFTRRTWRRLAGLGSLSDGNRQSVTPSW